MERRMRGVGRRSAWGLAFGFAVAAAICLIVLSPALGAGKGVARAGKTYRIGVVLQNFTNPAIKSIGDAITAEGKKYKNAKFLVQSSNTLQEQVSKAQTMISQHVSALGLEPWEAGAITPVLKQAKAAHIPVFFVQDNAPGAVQKGLGVTYIGGNETTGGLLVGKALRAALRGSGDVAIIEGAAGDQTANARTSGFNMAIKGSQVNVVAATPANWARDTGLSVTTNVLTAHPTLKAIFAENDEMAFGALDAIKSAGKTGQIVLAGYNGTCTGLQAALNGQFQYEGVLFLEEVGSAFADSSMAYLNGKKVPPRIVEPILALSTAQLQAVLTGKLTKGIPSTLKPRLQQAKAGKCS